MALAALAAAVLGAPLGAQTVAVGDPLEDYARVLQLLGRAGNESFSIRPVSAARLFAGVADTGHPWAGMLGERATPRQGFRIEPASVALTGNSAFAWGQNDGALWQGRGLSGMVQGGAGYRLGMLDVTLAPALVFAGNSPYSLAWLAPPSQNSPFANPWHRGLAGARIDMPQRFGPKAFAWVDPGQSEARLTWRALQLGAGTNNLWWGPGIRNAIVMSNNAPGFPHAYVGTSRPVNVWLGRLETRLYWGALRESPWYDTVAGNNDRYFTGIVATLQPAPLRGLTLGGTRAFDQYPPHRFTAHNLLTVFEGITKVGFSSQNNPLGNDSADQVLSLFARWAIPSAGFEAYLEWARNDHNWDLRDLELEPEHSQAYTLGFQRAIEVSGGRIVRLQGELTHLERDATSKVRGTPGYYSHSIVRHGYTNRGEVLGAGIGPGGDAQALAADVFTRWGRVGGFIGRQVHDNDAYYTLAADSNLSFNRHWVEFQLGARALVMRGPLSLDGGLTLIRQLNRYYILKQDRTNINLAVTARWYPERRRS